MKITLTKDEVEKLIRTLDWVNFATQDTEESREQIKTIIAKLAVGLKNARQTTELKIDIVDV
jgi:hypothetical protein